MKLQQKILLAPAIALVFLVLFGLITLGQMRSQRAALEDIVVNRFGDFEFATRIARRMDETNVKIYRLFNWLNAYDEAKIKAASADIVKSIDGIDKEIAARMQSIGGDEHKQKTAKGLQDGLKKYKKYVEQALDMATVDVSTAMAMMQTADEAYMSMERVAEGEVTTSQKATQSSYESMRDGFTKAFAMSIVILVAAVVGGLLVSLLLGRRIMKPLRHAGESAARIASGDLTARIEADTKDEVGDLLRSLEAMRNNLRGMIDSIRGSAREVGGSTGQLVSAAGQVASASQAQSENASSMAAAIEQLTVSINQMADNANRVDELSRESGEVSRRGGEVIRSTLEDMKKIAATVTEAAQNITRLGEQSAEISKVVGVIKEIADQTNLLALNAAIEAARAGEQGRGFAVVADEVRKLAERTTHSTEEIRQMVTGIQGGAQNAVAGMDRAVSAVKSGVALAEQAGDSTRQITERTDAMAQEVASISAALKEQGAASNDIAQRVEKIVHMSEENSSSAQGSADAARKLQDMADQMSRQVDRFRC